MHACCIYAFEQVQTKRVIRAYCMKCILTQTFMHAYSMTLNIIYYIKSQCMHVYYEMTNRHFLCYSEELVLYVEFWSARMQLRQ
jgi:hypothetical protein